MMLTGALAIMGACGSPGTYSRTRSGADGGPGNGATGGEIGAVDAAPTGSGGRAMGSGGAPAGTGGAGSGGAVATGSGGANATGGANGTGGAATGGAGTGGAATGGRGTGGAAAGGRGTGGAATGGVGTGGAATGGVGTGGAATGGRGTGGAGTGGSPSPRIVSIDFVGGRAAAGAGGTVSIPMGLDETAGVKAAKNWNSAPGASGSLASLRLADGTAATGASATWNAPLGGSPPGIFGLGYTDMPGDVRMMNGCLNPAWSSAPASPVSVLSVLGLPANITTGGYDVYVYVLGGIPSETRGYEYTIGTTTIKVTQVGPTPAASTPYVYTLAPDGGSGNYVVFKNLTTAAFELLVKSGTQTSAQFRSPINGIQIVSPSGS